MPGKAQERGSWQDADDCLPSDDLLAEQAYLVARGVRPLALAGHCPSQHVLRAATRVERLAVPGVVPFVLDHRDGTASFGALVSFPWVR